MAERSDNNVGIDIDYSAAKYHSWKKLEVKVTRIRNRWHARLIDGSVVIDEMACSCRSDIGYICREMLRWYDKNGGLCRLAMAARKRQVSPPIGRIWYRNSLSK